MCIINMKGKNNMERIIINGYDLDKFTLYVSRLTKEAMTKIDKGQPISKPLKGLLEKNNEIVGSIIDTIMKLRKHNLASEEEELAGFNLTKLTFIIEGIIDYLNE